MTFTIFTLGCKVNTYESNVISDLFINAGYLEVKNNEKADVVIINTCTVTNVADHKSQKIIRHAIALNPEAIVVACGCLVQVSKEEVLKIPGVDILVGNQGKTNIVKYVDEYRAHHKQIIDVKDISNITFESMCLNNFNKTRAFVKIQDGCNNFCAYCIIPYTRGNVRSKKREDVLDEVTKLVNEGHKEIVLTGIHTGNYGAEFENYDFASLLGELTKIKGLERIRISSIEMNEINERVLKIMQESKVVVDHLHIPLQSGANKILKLMNRKYLKEDFIKKIEEIRKIRPDIAITTDVIVGFPSETLEDFEETIDTIKKINFAKLHVFPYSLRENTKAALMSDQVDEKTKKERVHTLLELSKELERNYQEKFIGKTLPVLFETYKNGVSKGHTGNYLTVIVKGPNLRNETREVYLKELTIEGIVGDLTNERKNNMILAEM